AQYCVPVGKPLDCAAWKVSAAEVVKFKPPPIVERLPETTLAAPPLTVASVAVARFEPPPLTAESRPLARLSMPPPTNALSPAVPDNEQVPTVPGPAVLQVPPPTEAACPDAIF